MFDKLRWRLVPLYIAAAVLMLPLIQQAWTERKISQSAQASHAQVSAAAAEPSYIKGIPSRIIIPKSVIDLPVVAGSYDPSSVKWSVSAKFANYAVNTAPANNKSGQTLIYGHNNRSIFGRLTSLQPGDKVYVHTSNSHVFEYEFIGSQIIDPESVNIFTEMKKDTGLKLITCQGPNYERRLVASFRLVGSA